MKICCGYAGPRLMKVGFPGDFRDSAIEETLPQTVVYCPIRFLASTGKILSAANAAFDINSVITRMYLCGDFVSICHSIGSD